jgi:hypothetical protein
MYCERIGKGVMADASCGSAMAASAPWTHMHAPAYMPTAASTSMDAPTPMPPPVSTDEVPQVIADEEDVVEV